MINFKTLQKLVAECTDSRGPSMYRTLYKVGNEAPSLQIHDWDAWRALPLISKEHLTDTPLANRFFSTPADVEDIRTSSGTSGKTPPFVPRAIPHGLEYRLNYHSFEKPILAFKVPCMPHWHEALQISLGYSPRVIAFDPKHASASIQLARIAGVDAISTFAFHMPLIGELMLRESMTEQIRFIEMCGESCTKSLFEFLRKTFPNAVLIPQFGAAEVEDKPAGIPCRAITGEEPLSVYHIKASQFHEIIDPDSLQILPYEPGVEGELVLTSFSALPRSTPLIRYRTGDIIRVLPSRCIEHDDLLFTLIGRVSMDFVKIPGGMLRADETERVLRTLSETVTDRFELHRFLRPGALGPIVEVVLYVEPRGPLESRDLSHIATAIAKNLRVGPSKTYAEGVSEGIYLPLTCRVFTDSKTPIKRKRIVVH